MCIQVDDVENKYKHIPDIPVICEDWRRERMRILETTPEFEKIHWPLLEIDRRFENIVSFVLEYANVRPA